MKPFASPVLALRRCIEKAFCRGFSLPLLVLVMAVTGESTGQTALAAEADRGPSGAAQPTRQPLSLHPKNPHYLLFRGQPTILVTSGEHYGAVLNRDFDFSRYLKTLDESGFNLTRTFSGAYCEPQGAFRIVDNTLAPQKGRLICPWARSDQPGYANGGNRFDLTRWDPEYFRRLRRFLQEASDRGIVVELVLFCPFYRDEMWRLSPMNAANNVNGIGAVKRTDVYTLKDPRLTEVQIRMVRRIVRELKDFDNLYYEICNEPYFGGVTLEWQRRIAQVIAETERELGVRHLIAQNIANKSAKIEQPNPLVSIFNFHYAEPSAVTLNYDLERALADDETGFRGREAKPYRIEAWRFLLSGGAIVSHLDYSFTCGHEDGTATTDAPGGGGPEIRKQLRVLKTFVESFSFLALKPDPQVIVRKQPQSLSVHCLAHRGHEYAVYVVGNGPAEFDVELPQGRWRFEWIDTLQGRTLAESTQQHSGGALRLRSPAFRDDIALRIRRAEATR